MTLSEEEIYKVRQLICNHTLICSRDFPCSCCGNTDSDCAKCGVEIKHQCNDHDTEDGYCSSCR